MGEGRRILEDLARALTTARELRYRRPDELADVTDHELDNAGRALKAIAYSCTTGARHLDAIRRGRRGAGNPVPPADDGAA